MNSRAGFALGDNIEEHVLPVSLQAGQADDDTEPRIGTADVDRPVCSHRPRCAREPDLHRHVVAGLGAVGGAVSGAVSYLWKVQPLIVTLAVGTVVTGFMLVWLGGVQPPPAPTSLARLTVPVSTTFGLQIPPIIVVWAIVIVVITVLTRRTSLGRGIYLFGSSARGAELTLVPIRRLWIGGFAFSALNSALVGVLLAGFSGTADPSMGGPYLFLSLTAVIAGGTAFGARGGYARTVLGALTLVVLSTILSGKGYSWAD